MDTKIPLLDTHPEVDSIWDELMSAIQRILKDGRFIMGPDVADFEKEMADYLGVKYTIACNSGTDALLIGIRALGIAPGDEVITTPFTFFATAEAISHAGAIPVFVDIDPVTFNLDVNQIKDKITSKTKAIIPVHLFGHSADMDPIMDIAKQYGLIVLEDVAQAFGAEYKGKKVATIGNAGALSFFPSKNLGAFGDGGMLVTNNETVANSARMLRVHGAKKKYFNETLGYNSRLDTLQAAILRVKLPHIDEWNEGRRRVANRYCKLLKNIPELITPTEASYTKHVYHQYTLRIQGKSRDALQEKLKSLGIGTMVYYPVPVHKLPVYSSLNITLPTVEKIANEVISLPIWPKMEEEKQIIVAEQIKSAIAQI